MITDTLSRDEQLASVIWALERMIELRRAGEKARFRIQWVKRNGRRVYRLEIRRESGTIERPPWPLPLGEGEIVEEPAPEEPPP